MPLVGVNVRSQLDFGAQISGQTLFWVFLHDANNIWVSGLSETVRLPQCGCASSNQLQGLNNNHNDNNTSTTTITNYNNNSPS